MEFRPCLKVITVMKILPFVPFSYPSLIYKPYIYICHELTFKNIHHQLQVTVADALKRSVPESSTGHIEDPHGEMSSRYSAPGSVACVRALNVRVTSDEHERLYDSPWAAH